MPESTVSIINLSKTGRKYQVQGAEKGKDRDGNITYETLVILPDQKAVEVPEASAKFLLGKNAQGRATFPDLIDASQFRPELAKEKEQALAENAKLLEENEKLRNQLKDAGLLGEPQERTNGKGGKKK